MESIMKFVLFTLALSLLLNCPLFAEETTVDDYDYTQTYDGRFESDQLFQWSTNRPIWLPTRENISDITCDEALDSLHQTGVWTGHLSDEGECLGTAEAPQRSCGNFLNYLHQKMIRTQIPAE
jgi:hypothetical protein